MDRVLECNGAYCAQHDTVQEITDMHERKRKQNAFSHGSAQFEMRNYAGMFAYKHICVNILASVQLFLHRCWVAG